MTEAHALRTAIESLIEKHKNSASNVEWRVTQLLEHHREMHVAYLHRDFARELKALLRVERPQNEKEPT